MGELITGIALVIKVFKKYAGKEGDKNTLTNAELKDLISNEMVDPTKKSGPSPDEVAKIFKKLDGNADGVVDFPEYLALVGGLAMCCQQCCK